MSRSLPEWRGRTDDTAAPPRVKLRIHAKAEGKCAICGLDARTPEYDHTVPLILGGENRESNLRLLCKPCHAGKTRFDVKLKAKVARVRKKHLGIAKPKGMLPGSRASNIKMKVGGGWEYRR